MTLNISTDAEKKLRERASAEGKEPSQYAAEIVEHALSDSSRHPPEPSEEERARLRAAAERLIQKARDMGETMTPGASEELANSEGGASSPTILPPPTAAAVDDFLKEVEQLEPDPKRPRLRGQEAEIEAMIVEKHLLNRSRR